MSEVQSIAISLKNTFSTASVSEIPKRNKHSSINIGKMKRLTQANLNPKNTMIIINGMSENKKLINPERRVDIGKIKGEIFMDFNIPLLETMDVSI